MSAGTSLPGDFTPLPQVLLPHAAKAFVQRNIAVYGMLFGPAGSEAPFWLLNDPIFGNGGQYIDAPYFKRIPALSRRDVTSVSALTASKVEGGENVGVLVNRRSDLMKFTDSTWIRNATREAISAELGRQLGELILDDVLATAHAALKGLIEAVTAAAHTYTVWVASGTKANLDPAVIDGGRALMGDAWEAITHLCCHSGPNTDLRADARGRGYDTVGGATLRGDPNANGYGLKKCIRDDAIMITTDGGFDKYYSFLLGRGVLKIKFVKPFEIETWRDLTIENKATLWRGDGDYSLRCDEISYNSGAGGANPTNATLAASANWSVGYENHKELKAIELEHNYSAGS